jgi:ATP-dependent Lhr-like helicase
MEGLKEFHPAVKEWFESHFEAPTEPQKRGWPEIAKGRNTLISAPTGSGKTLAAFLSFIDRLLRREEDGGLEDTIYVVYVSPLKALSNDIKRNLETPLQEIRQIAKRVDMGDTLIRTFVRTGDTPPAERQAMLRRPPHILITTPESLYLMITSERSREMFRRVEAVIVDEIHALVRDKRGSHLALTLGRLDEIVGAYCNTPFKKTQRRPLRIGLSATQRPLDAIAQFLVGADAKKDDGSPDCVILDLGHQRDLDLAIELPPANLQAVASNEMWGDIYNRLAALIQEHRTTLVFVNTRRLAERVAYELTERLEKEKVSAHHGSLSKARRVELEERLKEGKLKALVATASLELGIDIGTVDLVCQLQSPRSIATFLQRIGRSGHALGLRPKGRLFPTTRDELIECTALIWSVRKGRLDSIISPVAPLDILAQQIVAACASRVWKEDELFEMVRRVTPYSNLERRDFDHIVEMLSEGFSTRQGRRSAYLHRDRINSTLRGRRGARLAALTSGGAIPEVADYRVIAEPEGIFVGMVNEDFAVESASGDIFLLGTTSWRIRRIEAGTIRVEDARGAPPNVPFWLGEAPARTDELSEEVSLLREEVAKRLEDPGKAEEWLISETGLDRGGVEQIIHYLAAIKGSIGLVPTQNDIVFERFFDDTGGMQLVIHSPFGARINRAFGLSLRKRFCQTFDFELQSAASDDAVLLSLSLKHSFPLENVYKFLNSKTVKDVLIQALLASPMFITRWRWNATRALAVLRQRGGRRVPPPIQRIQAEDLLALVFPSQVACQENVTYPIKVPDHPLVRQTVDDCVHEAMDIEGLIRLLHRFEKGGIRLHVRDTREPSPMTHEILNGKPFTFLDDAPLEERRARMISLRRVLPEDSKDLGRLDRDAIERVREESWPEPRDPDEVHDGLLGLWVIRKEVVESWEVWLNGLMEEGRAALGSTHDGVQLYFPAENLNYIKSLYPGIRVTPEVHLPEHLGDRSMDRETALVEVLRRQMEHLGPVTISELAYRIALVPDEISRGLIHLETEGFLLRGRFRIVNPPLLKGAGGFEEEFCERRLLARIHRYTLDRLRKEIEPVSGGDLMRFLLEWNHVARGSQLLGKEGVYQVIAQLQGFEIAASAWESQILPSRVSDYQSSWLDSLCYSGATAWGRLSLRNGSDNRGSLPSRSTPITLATRQDLPWLIETVRNGHSPVEPRTGAASQILALLREKGALFYGDLIAGTGRLPAEVEDALWELVSRGLVTGDGFQAIRSLLVSKRWRSYRRAGSYRQRGRPRPIGEGRWGLLPNSSDSPFIKGGIEGGFKEGTEEEIDLAERVAKQLLERYGIVFRDIITRECYTIPWRDVIRVLRRYEARGIVRGGRFVAGVIGEQYALPEAVDGLRRVRRKEKTGEVIQVSAVDPLNLVGILTPGSKVPAIHKNSVIFRDGIPVASFESSRFVVRAKGGEEAAREVRLRSRVRH